MSIFLHLYAAFYYTYSHFFVFVVLRNICCSASLSMFCYLFTKSRYIWNPLLCLAALIRFSNPSFLIMYRTILTFFFLIFSILLLYAVFFMDVGDYGSEHATKCYPKNI